MASLAQISKRAYLAELIGKYIEETEVRKPEPKRSRGEYNVGYA